MHRLCRKRIFILSNNRNSTNECFFFIKSNVIWLIVLFLCDYTGSYMLAWFCWWDHVISCMKLIEYLTSCLTPCHHWLTYPFHPSLSCTSSLLQHFSLLDRILFWYSLQFFSPKVSKSSGLSARLEIERLWVVARH